MTEGAGAPDRRFVRAIESAWMALAGRPVVVSPRDFEMLAGWHRRGIPLRVVLAAIEEWGRTHRGRPPGSLRAFAPAIEAAWEAVRSGRAAAAAPSVAVRGQNPIAAWERARSAPAPQALRALLDRAIAAARGGEEPAAVDAAVDRGLPQAAPQAAVAAADGATTEALAPFRSRMSPDAYRSTWERARADRLRDALGVPRLAPAAGRE